MQISLIEKFFKLTHKCVEVELHNLVAIQVYQSSRSCILTIVKLCCVSPNWISVVSLKNYYKSTHSNPEGSNFVFSEEKTN